MFTSIPTFVYNIKCAGSIHLVTLVKNPRVKLLYIVEDDKSKWGPLKQYWNLTSTVFLTHKEADKVYQDKK